MAWQGRALVVANAGEAARFEAKIVRGPRRADCWVWIGAIGDDGYGRFSIQRDGREHVVRPSRYAIAYFTGEPVPPGLIAMHDRCDNPICVRAGVVDDVAPHVVLGTQSENLASMGDKGRGGGGRRPRWHHDGLSRAERVARSKALRAAVRDGWDEAKVFAALAIGAQPGLFGPELLRSSPVQALDGQLVEREG
ncbi:MAG: hypothetical protein H5T78_02970 [Nocardia sp.]|nr:hypothetical protein [Nocardia sp.]